MRRRSHLARIPLLDLRRPLKPDNPRERDHRGAQFADRRRDYLTDVHQSVAATIVNSRPASDLRPRMGQSALSTAD
jgi:hypothetical protein